MIFCCSQFDDVALFWPWKGICNSAVVALAGCTTYPFILCKFPFLFFHCVYTVTEKQELWTGTLCSITYGLHYDREQEVHESCVTCGLLCLPCEICARLVDYGYGVPTFCVCACGSIIALSPIHCWYVLMCTRLCVVSIPIKKLRLMSSDSKRVSALSGWLSVTLQ